VDGLIEYLLLFLQEGLIGLEQHVPIITVLLLDLHDVPVLAEDVLPKHLKARAILGVDSLLGGHHLPPSTLGEVQGSGKQTVQSSLEVLMGVTRHAMKGRT
jgi:hypothetical protein